MNKNYTITLHAQCATDAEALAKAAGIALDSGEIAYLCNGVRDLGFFTKDGDYGAPKTAVRAAKEHEEPSPLSPRTTP